MEPFDRLPGGGRQLLGHLWQKLPGRTDCRGPRGYGVYLMRLSGVTTCAYCDLPFTEDLRFWMTMQLDHVVPQSVGTLLNIPREYIHDPINFVLACSRCNGFCNRYKAPEHDPRDAWSVEAFAELRDAIFQRRRELIAAACSLEQATFASQPWLSPLQVEELL